MQSKSNRKQPESPMPPNQEGKGNTNGHAILSKEKAKALEQSTNRQTTKRLQEAADKKTATSGFIIERTAKRMKQSLQKRLAEEQADITADQWILLNILADDGPASQFEIAERSYKDAPTVTRMIDLLHKKGLVDRLPDPDDRRRFQIVLTKEGQQKYEETLPLVREIRALGYDGLTDADLNQLIRIMNTIFQNFDNAKSKDHALL